MNQEDSKRPSARRATKALGEFTIIVVGVLAALGVQAMWEGLEERDREAGYLEQILGDARANLVALTLAHDTVSARVVAIESLRDALDDADPIHEASARAWVSVGIHAYTEPGLRLGSLSALFNTGFPTQ